MKNQYDKKMIDISEYDDYLFDLSFGNLKCQHYGYEKRLHLDDKLKRILDLIKPEDISPESSEIENWEDSDWDKYNLRKDLHRKALEIYDEKTPNKYKAEPKKNYITTFLNLLKDPRDGMSPYIEGYFKHHTIDNEHVNKLKQILEGTYDNADLEME